MQIKAPTHTEAEDQSFVTECEFDNRLNVLVLYQTHPLYDDARSKFESTHAFLIAERQVIVIDGEAFDQDWFTPAHFDVIVAHEVGHFRLGTQEKREFFADVVGYWMIQDKTLYTSLMIERYGDDFEAQITNNREEILAVLESNKN